jgi:RecA/RadA recombinase
MDAKNVLAKRPKPVISRESAVSTGSTLLNLACSDNPDVGFIKGKYYYIVGDSQSGKTWTTLSCFAEACDNPAFDSYRLIFDDVEGGALMDIEHYFGKKAASRVEPPKLKKGVPCFSDTIESFYYNIADAIEEGIPFIYVLDSQDALVSKASNKKFQQQKKADEENEKQTGAYGDGKAKYHSEHLRLILSDIRRMGSILIIVGQTRDNLGFGFNEKTRSGGRALRFYATLEVWTSVKGKLQKDVRGTKRTTGIKCLAEVKKNRHTGKVGKDRSVIIPIYYGMGIDDVGACVDFLIKEKHWQKQKGKPPTYVAHDIDGGVEGTRSQLISHIEKKGLEAELKKSTAAIWEEIEAACQPRRKKRYE